MCSWPLGSLKILGMRSSTYLPLKSQKPGIKIAQTHPLSKALLKITCEQRKPERHEPGV